MGEQIEHIGADETVAGGWRQRYPGTPVGTDDGCAGASRHQAFPGQLHHCFGEVEADVGGVTWKVLFQQSSSESSGPTTKFDHGLGRTKIAFFQQSIECGILVIGLPILTTTKTVVKIPGLLPGQDRAGYWGR